MCSEQNTTMKNETQQFSSMAGWRKIPMDHIWNEWLYNIINLNIALKQESWKGNIKGYRMY